MIAEGEKTVPAVLCSLLLCRPFYIPLICTPRTSLCFYRCKIHPNPCIFPRLLKEEYNAMADPKHPDGSLVCTVIGVLIRSGMEQFVHWGWEGASLCERSYLLVSAPGNEADLLSVGCGQEKLFNQDEGGSSGTNQLSGKTGP